MADSSEPVNSQVNEENTSNKSTNPKPPDKIKEDEVTSSEEAFKTDDSNINTSKTGITHINELW